MVEATPAAVEAGSEGAVPKSDAKASIIERMQLTDWFTGAGTLVIAAATIWNVFYVGGQLQEMRNSSADTAKLIETAKAQEKAMESQAGALDKLRQAGENQATAADKLRQAGEAQAKAMAGLQGAGEAQARSTASLAQNSGKQIPALLEAADAAKVQADSARTQAIAISKSADAAILASKSTDRLAQAGQAQADAIQQSLAVARDANDISRQASAAANRPWLEIKCLLRDIQLRVRISQWKSFNKTRGAALPCQLQSAYLLIYFPHLPPWQFPLWKVAKTVVKFLLNFQSRRAYLVNTFRIIRPSERSG